MTALDSTSLELLRQSLITCAAASAPNAVTLPIVRLEAKRMGHRVDDERLLAELDYLIEKGLLALAAKLISPANRAWKITGAGRDYAETEGLA